MKPYQIVSFVSLQKLLMTEGGFVEYLTYVNIKQENTFKQILLTRQVNMAAVAATAGTAHQRIQD